MKISVYEEFAYLYGFPNLDGKPAELQYLPTPRSRKWRNGYIVMRYNDDVILDEATKLMLQNNWHTFRFVEA